MITAPLLEIAVLMLGMVILMTEAFAGKIDKRVLAFAAIVGLAIVLIASFFVVPSVSPFQATGFWSFYTADRMAIFFKQFALLTTILVLVMLPALGNPAGTKPIEPVEATTPSGLRSTTLSGALLPTLLCST